jgi:hypothetical protein
VAATSFVSLRTRRPRLSTPEFNMPWHPELFSDWG